MHESSKQTEKSGALPMLGKHATCGHCAPAEPAREMMTPPPKDAEWVCPMHPEIVRDRPASCPICGMALEPRVASPNAEASPELRDMTRRFWVSLFLTLPLLVIAM